MLSIIRYANLDSKGLFFQTWFMWDCGINEKLQRGLKSTVFYVKIT